MAEAGVLGAPVEFFAMRKASNWAAFVAGGVGSEMAIEFIVLRAAEQRGCAPCVGGAWVGRGRPDRLNATGQLSQPGG